ncbi:MULTISPECIES: response regulator [Pseudanabaena]|uniref:Multi-component transcriptional regulator, winged helix family n=2 Tax=Pseudanabaena TaxID=1152 RepID=L8N4R9_9CYAN|nr:MULTISPECIES: response regulator [Pseudanabaena]ELS34656.1 multi-component transcriptional regulator, winged helix family [Pseudanabaena biceps PCC 7429]MDG3493179.1 response regulator [Pseudanabaena catenata USMAC16]
MKILIVEDDGFSAARLVQLLAEFPYTIDIAPDAKAAWQYIETYTYDLMVLDIMLPDSNGIDLCAKLRTSGYMIPVLLLTAKDSMSDRVMGLEAGADDYVVKPYEFQELIARIRALLRRAHNRDSLRQTLTWENLCLDFGNNTISYNQKPLHLTQKEYGILELLLRHPQQIFSRSSILDLVWAAGDFPSEESVTTHIKGLRQKLKTAGMSADPIETLYGLGYRLRHEPSPDRSPDRHLDWHSPVKSVSEQIAEAKLKAAIAEITEKLRESLAKLIPFFRQVAIALEAGSLDPKMRDRGCMEAHRLVGSLGTLGFPQGSAIALQIEQLLQHDFSPSHNDVGQFHTLIDDLETSANEPLKISKNYITKVQKPIDFARFPKLLIVDSDVEFVQEMQRDAEAWGIVVETAHSLATAKAKLEQEAPDIILLDILLAESNAESRADSSDGLRLLDELSRRQMDIPTLITTAKGNLSDRVMTAKKGGHIFIEKPALTEEILGVISQLIHRQRHDRPRVMIVDDDPHILEVLKILLAQWDLEVTLLQDCKQFWQVLESTAPDLLLLDLSMPDYNGIDLCRAVRTDSLWQYLPIVFLSSSSDRDTIHQVFAAGADDYLSKPIVEEDLQTRILSRLERSLVSRQAADFDGLTGLYTHRR